MADIIVDRKNNIQFLVVARQLWRTKKYSYRDIARPCHGLLFLKSGKIDYLTENEVISLKPYDLVYLPKNSNYEVIFHTEEGKVEDFLINFDLEDEYADLPDSPVMLLNDTANLLSPTLEQAVSVYNKEGNSFLCKSLLYMCMNNIALLYDKGKNDRFVFIETAKRLLCDNTELSIGEIAERLSLSHSSFQRKFKESLGFSPVEFRILNKIERAKQMLISGDSSIKEIAFTLDFYDVSYFYKTFYKYCKITPKKYRENHKTVI